MLGCIFIFPVFQKTQANDNGPFRVVIRGTGDAILETFLVFQKIESRGVTRYNLSVIRSFKHKGLERFFKTGRHSGIQAKHAARLRLLLGALEAAVGPQGMNLPAWKLHPLKGARKGFWAVKVDENWRLVFRFDGTHAVDVDYEDYH